MNITQGFTETCTYNAYIEYKNNKWGYVFNDNSTVETSSSLVINGNISQDFEIGPTLKLTVYRIVGPYIDLRLTEDFDLCTDFTFWQTNLNIGGSLTLGAKAEVFSRTLIDISKTWAQGFYHYQFPHQLEVVSGNNQKYTQGSPLDHPVKLQVKSNKNMVLAGASTSSANPSGDALKSCRQVNSPLGGDCNTTEHLRWNANTPHHGIDAFGFSALPGGMRLVTGSFGSIGQIGKWWSTTDRTANTFWNVTMFCARGDAHRESTSSASGLSVRCVRD